MTTREEARLRAIKVFYLAKLLAALVKYKTGNDRQSGKPRSPV